MKQRTKEMKRKISGRKYEKNTGDKQIKHEKERKSLNVRKRKNAHYVRNINLS